MTTMGKTARYLLSVNRGLARVPFMRSLAIALHRRAGAAASLSPTSAPRQAGLAIEGDADRHVRQLRQLGYSTGLALTPAFNEHLLTQFRQQSLVEDGTGRRLRYDEGVREGGPAALRWLNPHKTDGGLGSLAADERLVQVAQDYFGAAPLLHSTQIWLLNKPPASFAASAEYGWHYDIDDFRFLKVFFYLTDPHDTKGAHMLVSGSHCDYRPHRLLQRRIPDARLREKYRDERILSILGGAGSGFFEDTFLYHRATPPERARIMLQVEYCATGIMKKLEGRA